MYLEGSFKSLLKIGFMARDCFVLFTQAIATPRNDLMNPNHHAM
jgi:hypothetical protein